MELFWGICTSEFARRYGSFRSGISRAANYALSVIIIPILLALALAYLIDTYGVFNEFAGYAKNIGSIVLIGGFLTLVSFFNGYYSKGSYSRAVSGLVLTGFLYLFLWKISAIINLMFDITNILVDIDFSFFLFLIGIFCGMRTLYVLGELLFYRKRWNKQKYLIDASMHTIKDL